MTEWPEGWIIHTERVAHDPILRDECGKCLRAALRKVAEYAARPVHERPTASAMELTRLRLLRIAGVAEYALGESLDTERDRV